MDNKIGIYNAPKYAWLKAFQFVFIFLFFELLALSAGFAIWMMAHGIYLFISRLILYWKPARIQFTNLLHVKNDAYLEMPFMNWKRYIYLVFNLTLALGFIYFGTLTLVHRGFLNQNLIYLMTNK